MAKSSDESQSSKVVVIPKEEDDLKKLFDNSQETFNENPTKWIGLVRDKLFTMFQSPMKEEYAHEAFRWVAQLCMSAGDFSWMTTGGKWSQVEAKIFSLIARLSLAEVQLSLPLIQRHLTFGDEPEVEEGKILARSADHQDYDRFGTHLVIIESLIKSLVKDQTDEDEQSSSVEQELNPVTDAITPEELKNLLERLKETMTSICEYLELVHRHWQDVTKCSHSEKLSSAQGALRILSVWLSEDPGGFEPQCKRFLIDLMIKDLLLDDKPTRSDLTILALHSVCAESDELVEACKGVDNFEKALEMYLKYVGKESQRKSNDRRAEKMFKLRCGLVRDLAKKTNKQNT